MPRLLLVAYHFPPEPAAGALRPGYIASYLPEFGWDVTVLTRPLDQATLRAPASTRVVTAPVLGQAFERSVRGTLGLENGARTNQRPSLLRRALRWGKKTLLFPDAAAGWLGPAVARGMGEPFDAVLSTATPATVHLVGASVAWRRGVPWIADYRDPWAGNPGTQRGPVREVFEAAIERLLVRRAAAITTISDSIAGHLQTIHRRPIVVIPNGSESRDWDGLQDFRPSEFMLCYTGSMFVEHRTPALLFEALAALRAERDPAGDARVRFFGPCHDHVEALGHRYGLDALIERHGVVPRAAALTAQREASDLLIFLNMDPSTTYELGSKIIEYARAKRPILAFGPRDSVMREYLARTKLGWFASDLDEAKNAVRAAYRRFTAGDIEVQPAPGTFFEARDLAKAFAAQLDAVL